MPAYAEPMQPQAARSRDPGNRDESFWARQTAGEPILRRSQRETDGEDHPGPIVRRFPVGPSGR